MFNWKIKLTQIKSVFLLFALLIAAELFYTGCSEDAAGGGFTMPPMVVEAAGVKQQTVSDMYEAVGTIEAIEEITVVSEIDASVVSLPFSEGSFINKGDLIAQLDDSQLSAEEKRAEALYAKMEASYNRIKSVVDQKAGTPQDLDDALADLKVAEANLKVAEARLNKTRIIAPFNGIIGARRVSVGSFLRAGEIIAELANLNEIRINFSAPESYLSTLKRDAEVIVSSPVFPGDQLKGKIVVIEPVIDPDTRTARVVARMQNPQLKFRPGMSANVSVILNQRKDALTIPSEAVFVNGEQSFVYIIKPDSTVAPAPVTLGLQLKDAVEVITGLEKGMQIVTAGHQKLFPGAKVMPVTEQKTSMQ